MFFNSSQFRMHYEVIPGVLPTDTLFIHGNLASNLWWQPALNIWKKQSSAAPHQGVAILAEWRGCGDSSAPASEEELNPRTLAQDYVQLLRHLNKRSVAVVGHSTGGLIALMAMHQEPEYFSRAFLLDSVSATGVQFEPSMYEAFTQMSQNRSICAAVIGATIHACDTAQPIFEDLVNDAFRVGHHVWHGIPRQLHTVDFRSELSHIRQPVLVAHGELDTLLPIDRSRYLADNLPNGRFIEIAGQGHSTNIENPEKFVSLVNQYLFERF